MLKSTPRVSRPGATDECELSVRSLFDAEETPLLRYAFSLIGRRAVAEEIVQETFLQLHIHWDEIDSPRAWLYRSVRNRVYNHVRDSRREVLSGDDGPASTSAAHEEPPDGELEQLEVTAALRQQIEELNQTDRELVKLKYFEGLKYRDISDLTGLSISNVGYRLHHILKELAIKMRPHGIEEIL
ncbi:MAG: RNA polymerase sigma factor [Rubripirellula sp.]